MVSSLSEQWNIRTFLVVFFLILFSAFLMFPGLDHWYLWQDEALAAMLAKNTLKYGLPYVFDGVNVLWNNPANIDSSSCFFISYGWLPFYVNAFIFFLFGVTTFWARFSSVLAGCLFFGFMYLTLRRIIHSDKASLWAVFSLIFSVPLLLHFRQCHYYGLGVLFTWGLFHFFLLGKDSIRNYFFYMFSLALINTHLLEWGTLMTGFFLAVLAIREQRLPRLKMMAVNLFLCTPFLYLYKTGSVFGFEGQEVSPGLKLSLAEKILFCFSHIELSLLPLGLILILFIFLALFWHRMQTLEQNAVVSGLIVCFVSVFLTALFMPFTYFRYIVMIIPLFETVIILAMLHAFRFSKMLGAVFFILSFFFQFAEFRKDSEGRYFSYLLPYLQELRNDGEDFNEVLCQYLNRNAKKTDMVFCLYEEYPLMFYTSLAIRGGEGKIGAFPEDPRNKTFGIEPVHKPEWIVFRRGWEFLYPKDFLMNLLSQAKYEEVRLPVEDMGWGNRPCPLYHYFYSPLVENPLILYKRK